MPGCGGVPWVGFIGGFGSIMHSVVDFSSSRVLAHVRCCQGRLRESRIELYLQHVGCTCIAFSQSLNCRNSGQTNLGSRFGGVWHHVLYPVDRCRCCCCCPFCCLCLFNGRHGHHAHGVRGLGIHLFLPVAVVLALLLAVGLGLGRDVLFGPVGDVIDLGGGLLAGLLMGGPLDAGGGGEVCVEGFREILKEVLLHWLMDWPLLVDAFRGPRLWGPSGA